MSAIEEAAKQAQRRALRPEESVWVAASAGTGKTKVLTDRLLALMLDGTDPGRILCLTFTRAAAAEMANRINERLAAWTTMPPGRLSQDLVELTGRFPQEYEIARARQLFARVLDLPGGTKIATIHAFCQSLLRRFPLEAGVPPEFAVIDERSAREALVEAAEGVILAARAEREGAGGLAEALGIVAGYAPEERFFELTGDIAADRGKLRAALAEGEAALRRRLCGRLAVAPDATADELVAAFCARGACDEAGLRMAAEALAEGSRTDRQRSAILARWCETAMRRRLCGRLAVAPDATADELVAAFCARGACDEAGLRIAAEALAEGSRTDRQRSAILARWCETAMRRRDILDQYVGAFLTDQGDIRQVLITKPAAAKAAPADPCAVLQEEAERILRFQADRAGLGLVDASIALVRLGDALLDAYERRKRLQGVLDYDDLVLKALELLRRPGVAPWVLFKLDGGLDHILIDEAQDTNPDQWAIVAALAEEFFVGDGATERPRTVFAVGDAKQSIYSFQRADPHAFLAMRRHFEERVNAANQGWAVVPLEISFRASEPLLRAVDAVFRQADAAEGVTLDGAAIRHVAAREGQAGLVELWPPVTADPEPEPEPETAAAGAAAPRRRPEPRTRLARAIAATIAGWLGRGERLEPRGRALRAGDIMVLVRRRDAFVADLVRALKQKGVPVAGADRLALAEELAVQDLVALGQFLLLPEDDLTLATVLKGPLFGITEDELFLLAYGRGKERLWTRLRRLAAEHPRLGEAFERLRALLARADFMPPFELYAEILGGVGLHPTGWSPGGGRKAMLERLGPEAADPIDEFLALALAYEREHVPSLQGFLRWLIAGDIEVKRDLAEQLRDEVRILTVHGAKGLEAPVVFLPDTMQLPDNQVRLLWSEDDGLPLWRARGELATPFYRTERQAWRQRQLQEYRRLLYVALTRAQDRLYVCGWQNLRPVREAPCWHALCDAGWSEAAEPVDFDSRPLLGERDGWCGKGLRLVGPQTAAPRRDERAIRGAGPVGALPAWVLAPPPPEPSPPKPLLPSRPSGPEPATLSPLASRGRDRFKRGLIVHRLLQGLPEMALAERGAAARRFLALPMHGLDGAEQAEICAEVLAVLEDPRLAELWGPNSRAEVPIVGLIPGSIPGSEQALSGQIDRLVVTAARVLVVDFKTVRPPPASDDQVPALYLQQLAIYRAALGRIYPDRAIDCAFLWTDGPVLMPVGGALLDRHLPGRLASRRGGSGGNRNASPRVN